MYLCQNTRLQRFQKTLCSQFQENFAGKLQSLLFVLRDIGLIVLCEPKQKYIATAHPG